MNISNKIIDLFKKEKLDILECIEELRDLESIYLEYLKINLDKQIEKEKDGK